MIVACRRRLGCLGEAAARRFFGHTHTRSLATPRTCLSQTLALLYRILTIFLPSSAQLCAALPRCACRSPACRNPPLTHGAAPASAYSRLPLPHPFFPTQCLLPERVLICKPLTVKKAASDGRCGKGCTAGMRPRSELSRFREAGFLPLHQQQPWLRHAGPSGAPNLPRAAVQGSARLPQAGAAACTWQGACLCPHPLQLRGRRRPSSSRGAELWGVALRLPGEFAALLSRSKAAWPAGSASRSSRPRERGAAAWQRRSQRRGGRPARDGRRCVGGIVATTAT